MGQPKNSTAFPSNEGFHQGVMMGFSQLDKSGHRDKNIGKILIRNISEIFEIFGFSHLLE